MAAEAHAKLKRNLDLALQRHEERLSQPLAEETDLRNKRLVAEVANTTVEAALATDRNALKARQQNTIEIVMLRVLFARIRRGMASSPRITRSSVPRRGPSWRPRVLLNMMS